MERIPYSGTFLKALNRFGLVPTLFRVGGLFEVQKFAADYRDYLERVHPLTRKDRWDYLPTVSRLIIIPLLTHRPEHDPRGNNSALLLQAESSSITARRPSPYDRILIMPFFAPEKKPSWAELKNSFWQRDVDVIVRASYRMDDARSWEERYSLITVSRSVVPFPSLRSPGRTNFR